jgi:hypothetical protein
LKKGGSRNRDFHWVAPNRGSTLSTTFLCGGGRNR